MATPPLRDDEIHLWWAGLSLPDDEYRRVERMLSADERSRADRHLLEWRRRRFVTGRGILRGLLGEYLGLSPGAVRFVYGARGKPGLECCHSSDIEFSVAHSRDVALYAFGRGADVGVDIEHMQPGFGTRIVERFFSAGERDVYCALPEHQKPLAFLLGWTRKEAYLKGTGAGLSASLADLEVTLVPGEPARILATADSSQTGQWWLEDIAAAGGCVGAVAVSDGPRRLTTNTFASREIQSCWTEDR